MVKRSKEARIANEIKKYLKVPTNPRLSYRYKIPDRLASAHVELVKLKALYNQQFELVKTTMIPRHGSIQTWFIPLISPLQLYLDVKLLKQKTIVGNNIEPVNTLGIIGSIDNCKLASHYIDYLYTSVSLLTQNYSKEQSRKARQHRRKLRRGTKTGRRMGNVRESSSNFRKQVISIIVNALDKRLDSLRINGPELAYMRSLARQEFIEKRLIAKYTRSWKKVLIKG
jgi:hypothetical protein